MLPTRGYATKGPSSRLEPFNFERRDPGPHDVLIEILYCGICHSDIHQARDEWGGAVFPMVPGHEIVGRVERIGPSVRQFKVGVLAGVGCFVDSCRVCASCKKAWSSTANAVQTSLTTAMRRTGKVPLTVATRLKSL
jgi:uncharacterized zinc-type alcohol dehydrogenase-like protein